MCGASRALLLLVLLTTGPQMVYGIQPRPPKKSENWCALHVIAFRNDKDLEILGGQIPRLAGIGVNVLILEVDAAVDMIPKDIILCPWHYERMESYPSLPLFLEKGFRVLPASWRKLDASRALIRYSQKLDSPKLLGHLFTTWDRKRDALTEYQPLVEGSKLLRETQSMRPGAN